MASPALPQLVQAELLQSGEYDRHLRLVRGRQRAGRDAPVTALAQHLPGAVVSGVAAGLFVLITFPGSDADDVELAGSVRDAGVVVHPLSWHRPMPPTGFVPRSNVLPLLSRGGRGGSRSRRRAG